MMHVVEVLDRSGHLTLTWDPDIPESVERAQEDFAKLQAAGYEFFRVLNPDQPTTGFSSAEGALIVKRVTAGEVAPVVRNPDPSARRRGRQPKPRDTQAGRDRTVAMRPQRGG